MLDTVQFMQKNRFITDKAQEQACYFGVFVGMSIFVLWWPLIGRGGRLKRAQGFWLAEALTCSSLSVQTVCETHSDETERSP